MKKITMAAWLSLLLATAAAGSDQQGPQFDRVKTASTVLSQIMSAPDHAIPDGIMSGAKCIAIVPSMLKASFVFGANYGKGVATCRTEQGWSAPVFFRVTGGSFGLQAGGQASDLVLIIRTDEGMQHLLQSKFKLGADASAAAGPVGRDAQASTDLTLRAQILTYSRSRGLFLGVSLSGAVIRQDYGDTQAFYGKGWTFYSLLSGQVAPTESSQVLLKTVEEYAPTPKVSARATPPARPANASSVGQPAGADTPAAMPSAAAKPAAVEDAAAAAEPAGEADAAPAAEQGHGMAPAAAPAPAPAQPAADSSTSSSSVDR